MGEQAEGHKGRGKYSKTIAKQPTKGRARAAGFTSTKDSSAAKRANQETSPETQRPAKRVVRRAPSKRASQALRGQLKILQGCLKSLPTLPLDILFEIFSHLEPKDLVNLSRVSKPFRLILMTKSVQWLWKRTWKNVAEQGIPACPEGVSEPRWANLLFGGAACHTCGTALQIRIDFALRRRTCKYCLNEHLVNGAEDDPDSRITSEMMTDLMLACLPIAEVNPRDEKGKLIKDDLWWDEDVIKLKDEVETLIRDVATEDVDTVLKNFKLSKLEEVAKVEAHAEICAEWVYRTQLQRQQEKDDNIAKRYRDVVGRCLALGYAERDVKAIASHPHIRTDVPLTDASWNRIFPLVKHFLDNRKAWRLSWEEQQIRKRYIRVTDALKDYAQTLEPLDAACLPWQETDLAQFEKVQEYLESDVIEGLDGLPGLVRRMTDEFKLWANERKTRILGDLDEGDLRLAASVFTCSTDKLNKSRSPRSLYEGEVFRVRVKENNIDVLPILDTTAQAAVFSLLKALSLDPITTTKSTLDGIDCQFVCLNCSATRAKHAGSRKHPPQRSPLTWREAVDHHLAWFKVKNAGHEVPEWELLENNDSHS